jgi:hypothetical protein
MPSKRKKKIPVIHDFPCSQETRLERIEEDMGDQKECLIRIEEKLKNDYSIIGKIDQKLERFIEGNSSPGIPTRVSNLEQNYGHMKEAYQSTKKLILTLFFIIIASLATGFIGFVLS